MKHLSALLLLLFSGFVHSAITLDGTPTLAADDTSGGDTSATHTTGTCAFGNPKMIVMAGTRGAGAHTGATITYNGDALNLVAEETQLTDSSVWYLDNPDAGSNTVLATWGTTIGNWAKFAVVTVCGAEPGAPEDSDFALVNGGTELTNTLTSSEGAWVFSAATHGDLGPFVDANGQTVIHNDAIVADAVAMGRLEDVSAGSVPVTWDTTNAGSGALAVMSIAAAEAPGGSTIVNPISGRGGAAAQPLF